MRAIRSLLAALDESPRAPVVFAKATDLARQLGAQVFLIRVVWLPPDIPPAAHAPADKIEDAVEGATRAELHRLMETAQDVQFGPPIVVEGDPWRQILRVADQLDVDLIVVGNHRHHGLERVIGTVANAVVSHARRDVLVVRGQDATHGA